MNRLKSVHFKNTILSSLKIMIIFNDISCHQNSWCTIEKYHNLNFRAFILEWNWQMKMNTKRWRWKPPKYKLYFVIRIRTCKFLYSRILQITKAGILCKIHLSFSQSFSFERNWHKNEHSCLLMDPTKFCPFSPSHVLWWTQKAHDVWWTKTKIFPDSIADSGASAASSGGEWELMHYVH